MYAAAMATHRIETLGSIWFFNDDTKQYLRMPKAEVPREQEWDVESLRDLLWHDYDFWNITTARCYVEEKESGRLVYYDPPTLVIKPTEHGHHLYAPQAVERDCLDNYAS